MKFYSFGDTKNPVIMLLPGTCCHWKSNFSKVIPLLADTYHVLCVSYDGFDETEDTQFTTMLEETKKIEHYIIKHFNGHILAAYGCSLGGSFVGLIAAREKIHFDYGILGSSDLDQTSWAKNIVLVMNGILHIQYYMNRIYNMKNFWHVILNNGQIW